MAQNNNPSTLRSAGVEPRDMLVSVFDPDGTLSRAVQCTSLNDCRAVVRGEAKRREPWTIFIVDEAQTPGRDGALIYAVERWGIGGDGVLVRAPYRQNPPLERRAEIHDLYDELNKITRRQDNAWHNWETGKHKGSREAAYQRAQKLDQRAAALEEKIHQLEQNPPRPRAVPNKRLEPKWEAWAKRLRKGSTVEFGGHKAKLMTAPAPKRARIDEQIAKLKIAGDKPFEMEVGRMAPYWE